MSRLILPRLVWPMGKGTRNDILVHRKAGRACKHRHKTHNDVCALTSSLHGEC